MSGPSRRQVVILNQLGLHMRAATKFAQLARQFQSEVRVKREGREVNGKSALDLLTLAAGCGSRLELEASGIDSDEMLASLYVLMEASFYEVDDI